MTILVGYPTKRRARAVLELAGMLARSRGTDVVVCTAIRDPRIPGTRRDDPKFTTYVDELADTALAQARADMPDDVQTRFVRVDARSVSAGLIHAAEKYRARLIVAGSAMGRIEEVTVSSVADRLLHSSPIPVAVATRGFRAMGVKVRRVTLAFASGEDTAVHVAAAEEIAARYGAELRLASFAVNLNHAEAFRVAVKGPTGKQMWENIIRREVEMAVQADRATSDRNPELLIGHGNDWAEALDDIDWGLGDVLVVGSSVSGPLARVFVGSRASKIIRHSPVPVIALPRGAVDTLASE